MFRDFDHRLSKVLRMLLFALPTQATLSLSALLGVAVLVFSLGAVAQATKPADFSGFWLRDDGGVIKVSQDGANVKAVHVNVVPENREVYGFVPGDVHFEGVAHGRAITGKVMGHLPMAKWKPLCPGQWASWADNELTLTEDGNTLEGRWKHTIVSDKDCSIIREEWLPAKYVRSQVVSAAPGRLSVVAHGQQLKPLQLELILDASGSMWEKVEGRAKITAAKEVMTHIIEELPEDLQVALRIYGHRIAPGRPGACQDSELVFPFAKIDKPRLIQRVRAIHPLGTTPIAYSMRQVATDFGGAPGEKMVVLVTDGIEECRGSPAAAVSELLAKGLQLRINIVGFGFTDDASKLEMQRVAELSRGQFFDASNAKGLRYAIEGALAVPFDVLDANGASVGAGLVDREAIDVPEGTYKILVHVPGAPTTIEGITITHHKLTSVELRKQGDKIVGAVVAP